MNNLKAMLANANEKNAFNKKLYHKANKIATKWFMFDFLHLKKKS